MAIPTELFVTLLFLTENPDDARALALRNRFDSRSVSEILLRLVNADEGSQDLLQRQIYDAFAAADTEAS